MRLSEIIDNAIDLFGLPTTLSQLDRREVSRMVSSLCRYFLIDRVQQTEQHSRFDDEEDRSMGERIDQRALTFFDQTIEKKTFGLNGSQIGDVPIELMSKSIDRVDLHLHLAFLLQIIAEETFKSFSHLFGLSSMIVVSFEEIHSRMKNHFVSKHSSIERESLLPLPINLTNAVVDIDWRNVCHNHLSRDARDRVDALLVRWSRSTVEEIESVCESVVIVQRSHSMSTCSSVHSWTSVEQCHEHFVRTLPNDCETIVEIDGDVHFLSTRDQRRVREKSRTRLTFSVIVRFK
jgi:hypothetical protein